MEEILIVAGLLFLIDKGNKTVQTMGKEYPNPEGKTRGLRNNNVGNIKETGTTWKGQIKPTGDKPFAQFQNPVWGVRAMIIIVKRTYRNLGLKTIRQIVSRYAPPIENLTESYINSVSRQTGIDPDRIISTESEYQKVIQAMAVHENGLPVTKVLPDLLYIEANNLI